MRLYLSQLILDPRSRQVQAELKDPYQMHRTLSRAFGDEQGAWEAARALFRVDETDGKLSALVQSKTLPDWSSLTVSDGYLAADPVMKEFNPSLRPGQLLRFRLRANPTVKRDGKRIGIYDESERLAWLGRKGSISGFRVLEARVESDGKQKGITGKGCETIFSAAVFEGVLEVTDVEAFASALRDGIGSAKGFGFGLLSIAPARLGGGS